VGAPLRPSSTSVNPYSLPTAGALQYLSVFVAPSDTAGRETIQGVVYSDDHGTPDALLGTTEPLTITSADTVGDRQLDFTADLPVAAGPLWIGLIASGTPNIVTIRYQPTAVLAYRKDTDPGVPDDPFGPFLQATERISLEVGYAVDPDWP
jgi:hypothetical protein